MNERTFATGTGRVSLASVGDTGPNLVLLHSLLSNRDVFYRVVPALARQFRVHTVDLPGFGETDLQPPSMDAYGDVVGSLIEAAGFGRDTIILGNGLGGFVALAAAIRHGEKFDKLVIVGAGPGFPAEAKPAFRGMAAAAAEHGMPGVVNVAVRRVFSDDYLAAHPEEYAEREQVLLLTDVLALQRACEALWNVDYLEAVTHIANPTLVVVGSEDAATPPAMARRLHELIPSSAYVELDGIAHGPQLQDPDGFLDAIGPFIGLAPAAEETGRAPGHS